MTDEAEAAEDALCLRIGRVARAHVQIDNSLRLCHQTLMTPGLGVYLTNRVVSTSVLVEDCRLMVAKSEIPEHVAAAAKSALDAAVEASKVRNRVVHDMWLRDVDDQTPEQAPRWTAHSIARRDRVRRVEEPPRDLDFLDAAVDQLRRTNVRITALLWALWNVLPAFGGRTEKPDEGWAELVRWVAVMENRFDLIADGGFRAHDDPDDA